MSKMTDLGETWDIETAAMPAKKGEKKEKHYPSISLNTDQLPDLKGYKVGDKIMLEMEAVINGVRINKDKKGDKANYDIELKSASCEDMGEDDGMKEAMDMADDMEGKNAPKSKGGYPMTSMKDKGMKKGKM